MNAAERYWDLVEQVPKDEDHGLLCIDSVPHGPGAQAVCQFSSDARVWGEGVQSEVEGGRSYLGEDRRLLRR